MTKIVFVRLAPWMGLSCPHPQDAPYAYDVAQITAFLDTNAYAITFIDCLVENISIDNLIKRISLHQPDILAMTATSSVDTMALEIFMAARKLLPQIYLIAFGQHAHYSPHTFLDYSFHVDACVYGEPELTLVELIEKLPRTVEDKKRISGISYWNEGLQKTAERPLTMDLDQWPVPRYDMFKGYDYRVFSSNFPTLRRVKSAWILATRGCPYRCTICSPAIRRSYGTRLRRISPQRVADTFELLKTQQGINTILFGDDVFTLDMDWAEEVSNELIKRKNRIQWAMATRVDRLSSHLIKKMRDAGLRSVSLGVESGTERVLKDIKKNITLEQIEWAVKELEKHTISVNVTAIVGHVDETVHEMQKTFSFLKKINPIFVQLHYLSPYPGTMIEHIFKERIQKIDHISHFNAVPMNVSAMPDEMLNGSIQQFYREYYFSLRFFRKYMKERVWYTMCNPVKEFRLIKEAVKYFLYSNAEKVSC